MELQLVFHLATQQHLRLVLQQQLPIVVVTNSGLLLGLRHVKQPPVQLQLPC